MKTETEAQHEALTVDQELRTLDKVPFLILPDGYRAASLESFLHAPLAHKASVSCQRVASFIEMVKAFKTEATRGFIGQCEFSNDMSFARFTAVIDARQPGAPSWQRHSYEFSPYPSKRLMTWVNASNNPSSARNYALFIERHRRDVVTPQSADLLGIIRSIRGKANVEFSEEIDEHTGAGSHAYAESITLHGGKDGDLEIPGSFEIGVPIYENQGDDVGLRVILRPHVEDNGKVLFTHEIDQLDAAVEVFMKEIAMKIFEETGLSFLHATAS